MRKIYLSLLCLVAALAFSARIHAQYSEPQRDITIKPTTGPMVIDGMGNEASYTDMQTMQIAKRAGAAVAAYEDGDAVDFNASYKVCWDRTFLYLYVEIVDDIEESMPVGGANSWTYDNFEMFIDLDTASHVQAYDATSTIQLRFCRGDVGIESAGRRAKANWLAFQDNGTAGWIVELGIPWCTAAAANDTLHDMMAEQAEGIIGWDFAVADADGDGTGTDGGRNREGGAQMFWDLDTPIGNEDNAWQDRRTFGWATLDGDPYVVPSGIQNPAAAESYVVYPSPSNGTVTFGHLNGVKSFDIYNLVGVKVLTVDVTGSIVRVPAMKSGVYFAKINDQVLKFVVE